MTVGLIWAQARNGVIGRDGGMPWHLPEDLAHFKRVTSGATVIMGRRTWESLPPKVRPLPGRRNIVLTSRPGWSAPGAERADSLPQALAAVSGDSWVIGGGSVYRVALEHADLVVVTELREEFEGDVHAPALDPSWLQIDREPASGWAESSTGLHYRILTYRR